MKQDQHLEETNSAWQNSPKSVEIVLEDSYQLYQESDVLAVMANSH